jgi:mutator protein MutT
VSSEDVPSEDDSEGPMTIPVVAAVVTRGERYLVCQRAEGDRHGGLWEFPGGKLEAGETLLVAARRELSEELDLEVIGGGEAPRFVARDPGSAFEVAFVEVQTVGEPRCREHQQLAWCSHEQLLRLQLAPSDRRFVEQLLDEGKRR